MEILTVRFYFCLDLVDNAIYFFFIYFEFDSSVLFMLGIFSSFIFGIFKIAMNIFTDLEFVNICYVILIHRNQFIVKVFIDNNVIAI